MVASEERILVVDDDPQITTFLKRYLEKHGYCVICASDGNEMTMRLAGQTVDLCILDIGLPGKNGLDITRDLRARSSMPILVLSGRDDLLDRVVGLELGADDYMVKPFEPRELLARIRSILRRSNSNGQSDAQVDDQKYLFGNWVLSPSERSLSLVNSGESVPLTSSEYAILLSFVMRPNTVFTRNQLLDAARGSDTTAGDRTIDVHIMRLRKKLSATQSNIVSITTVHGVGYSFTQSVQKTA